MSDSSLCSIVKDSVDMCQLGMPYSNEHVMPETCLRFIVAARDVQRFFKKWFKDQTIEQYAPSAHAENGLAMLSDTHARSQKIPLPA